MNHSIIIIILSLLITVAGCTPQPGIRIGVSQCSQDDWRTKMNDEIYREILLHPEATVEIRSADDNNEKQIADIRYYMDNGFDAIIVSPNEADALTPIITEAYNQGIPVITFDRDINGDSYTARIGVDNRGIGHSAADYAFHLAGRGAKVIEIKGRRGSTPAIERNLGFADGAVERGLKILGAGVGNWNFDDAFAVADSLFELYPDADLVYAHNDRMATAASAAARSRGLTPYIIGIDAAPEIGVKAVADSVIDATFLYPTEGHRLIRTALAIVKGEPYSRVTMMPASSAVDRTNADIILFQNESLKAETEKMLMLKDEVDAYWSKHSAQTSLFYATIMILMLLSGVLFLLLRAFWQRKRQKEELEKQNRLLQEQRDLQESLNRQLTEATQSKLMFFTNVSHDLRTPLTLIAEPVEQLAKADNLTPRQHTLMQLADKNVRILRRLINQILDFRKYENGKLELALTEVDLASLIREWAGSFADLARKRDITLSVDIEAAPEDTAAVDVEKIERVFFNLMSNAFKYTPDNGSITLRYRVKGDFIEFSVIDTGRGIPAADLGNIFDRFYQVDKVHPNGSGIGLSLTKAFVELHRGMITVESEPGKGSEFKVILPVVHIAIDPVPAAEPMRQITGQEVSAELLPVDSEPAADASGKPLLLVIDDNEDIRRLLTELMRDDYSVITAPNGTEGVRMAAKYVPDLIICDIMMPGIDGLECTRRIKEEISTSHIPVLMLTACSMEQQRVEGYESGADGYVSKPFSEELLKARCRNLIENRRRIRDLEHREPRRAEAVKTAAHTAGAPRPDVESEFYDRFLAIVREQMGDPDLNVDSLAGKMGLGRSQFYRKIKALTNYSPVELLRRLRLNAARDLLTTTEKTVSEIAYEVGFASPAYFTRCYREAFGETPSDLRDKLR